MSEFNQAKYIQQYQKEKYDRCIFNVPKGQREKIQKHYEQKGFKSLNTYINDLIRKDMNETANNSVHVDTVNQHGNGTIHIG